MGEDESQIQRVLGSYCQLCDDGRFDVWADLFTEDGRLVFPGREAEGRDAIRSLMETVQSSGSRGKHMTANTLIDVDGVSASSSSDYRVVRPEDGRLAVVAAGRYHDRLARSGGRWRFTERVITMLGDPVGARDG